VNEQYVPEGHSFPADFPTDMFVGGYPTDPDAQQWVQMDGPDGELVFFNKRMNNWIAFIQMAHGAGSYVMPAYHENGGGGAVTLPYRLVRNDQGVVVDVEVVFWEKDRGNIASAPDQIDFEAIGGFQDPGESAEQTAKREHSEESGGIEAGAIREVSVRRSAADRATRVLLNEEEGIATFAYEATDEQLAAFEASGDHPIMSWRKARRSRCHITKGCVFDLVADISDEYETAL
jgi:hypothetical protein